MIARKLLPVRPINESFENDIIENGTNSTKYPIYFVCSGWTVNEREFADPCYHMREETRKDVAKSKIYKTEDNVFINGDVALGVIGISSTTTIRNNILDAIKEFPDYKILCSNKDDIPIDKGLNNIMECNFVPSNVIYLIPPIITNDIAEFVSTDITYYDQYQIQPGRNYWREMGEWISVEVHKPDVFVKILKND